DDLPISFQQGSTCSVPSNGDKMESRCSFECLTQFHCFFSSLSLLLSWSLPDKSVSPKSETLESSPHRHNLATLTSPPKEHANTRINKTEYSVVGEMIVCVCVCLCCVCVCV